jgi:hypothetical protein
MLCPAFTVQLASSQRDKARGEFGLVRVGQISDGSRRRWKIGFAKVVSMAISKNVLAYVNKIIMLEN